MQIQLTTDSVFNNIHEGRISKKINVMPKKKINDFKL